MAADYVVKQGDTAPALTDTLTYSDNSKVDLTSATVRFVARALSSPAPLSLTGTTSITVAVDGDVQFTPSAADTAVPGLYACSWVVTFNSGAVMTFPTQGYISWSIEPNVTSIGGQQLVGLPDVKDYPGINIPPTDRSQDARLLRFISAATPLIENIVGPVLVRTIEEWHTGGQYFIQLRRRPSRALGMNPVLSLIGAEEYRGPTKYSLTIVENPAAASTYSVMLDPGTGTVYRRTTGGGLIAFGAGPWGGGLPDAVRIEYQAGQSPVPALIQEATLEAIRVNYQTTMAVGRGSRTRADEFESGPPLGFFMPRRVLEMLSPARRAPSVA